MTRSASSCTVEEIELSAEAALTQQWIEVHNASSRSIADAPD